LSRAHRPAAGADEDRRLERGAAVAGGAGLLHLVAVAREDEPGVLGVDHPLARAGGLRLGLEHGAGLLPVVVAEVHVGARPEDEDRKHEHDKARHQGTSTFGSLALASAPRRAAVPASPFRSWTMARFPRAARSPPAVRKLRSASAIRRARP